MNVLCFYFTDTCELNVEIMSCFYLTGKYIVEKRYAFILQTHVIKNVDIHVMFLFHRNIYYTYTCFFKCNIILHSVNILLLLLLLFIYFYFFIFFIIIKTFFRKLPYIPL